MTNTLAEVFFFLHICLSIRLVENDVLIILEWNLFQISSLNFGYCFLTFLSKLRNFVRLCRRSFESLFFVSAYKTNLEMMPKWNDYRNYRTVLQAQIQMHRSGLWCPNSDQYYEFQRQIFKNFKFLFDIIKPWWIGFHYLLVQSFVT